MKNYELVYVVKPNSDDETKEIINQNQIEYKGIYKIYKQEGKKQVEEIN